jgi:hypothetical protein
MTSFEHVHLLEAKKVLDVVLEGKVERLGGEVTDDVGEISAPQGTETLLSNNTAGGSATIQLRNAPEAIRNTLVGGGETALLDHLVLVLDEQLDTLDGGSNGLGDTSGNTTKEKVLIESDLLLLTTGGGKVGAGSNVQLGEHCLE